MYCVMCKYYYYIKQNYYCKDTICNDPKMILGSHVNRPKQYNLQSVGIKSQINFFGMKRFTLTYILKAQSWHNDRFVLVIDTVLLLFTFFLLSLCLFLSLMFRSPFCMFFFQFIYHPLCSILTTHVQVGFGGFLSVSSSTSWNFLWAAVRLLPYCSGITSTLMRPESWLRGH